MSFSHRLISHHRWMSLFAGHFDEPYVACNAGVGLVPLTDSGDVLFIREPAIPDGRMLLTLPGGVVDVGENPAVAANRELQEEAGCKAGHLNFLGTFNPFGKHAAWDIHFFLGRDLTLSRLVGDEVYPITVEPHPLADLESLIAAGELTSASSIAAPYVARSFLAQVKIAVPVP